jgi:hypothetical protein
MLQNICFDIIIFLQKTGFEHATIEHWASLHYVFEWDYTCIHEIICCNCILSVKLSSIIVIR